MIKPVRTSERTVKQIVCEKELELYPYLVYNSSQFPSSEIRHREFCPCQECHTAIMQGILYSMEKKGTENVYSFDDPLVKL